MHNGGTAAGGLNPDNSVSASRESGVDMSTTTTTATERHETPKPPLPVDRGWAWFVMLGALINITSCITFIRAASLLFIEFLEKYQVSATLTTLAFSMYSVTFAVSSMLQPALFLPRFTVRTLALTGSTFTVLATTLIAFSPNIILTNVLFMFIGFGNGLIFVPEMALIGCYFKKRLSLAASCANLGLSIATIAGPPLAQYLLDTYGLQGAVLLLAGLKLHCVVGSMLFRPVSLYADPNIKSGRDDTDDTNSVAPAISSTDIVKIVKSDVLTSAETQSFENMNLLAQIPHCGGEYKRCRSMSESHPRAMKQFEINVEDITNTNKYLGASSTMLHGAGSVPNDSLMDKLSLSTSTRYLSNSSFTLTIMTSAAEYKTGIRSRAPSVGKQDGTLMSQKLKSNGIIIKERDSGCRSCFQRFKNALSGSIYTHPYFLMLVFASGLGVHAQAYYAYTPILGKEQGLTAEQVPLLLTVAGTCDLISKLGIGFIADLPWVKRIYLGGVIQLVLGITLQCVSFFKGYELMIVLQVIGGSFVQVLMTLLPAIAADLIGSEYIGHIMSGYFLVNGAVCTLDHIVAGFIKDITGSFIPTFNYMGAFNIFSFLLLALDPILSRKYGGK
ncbi:uncharacterized protein LOC101849510 [Aplysia californica]|uniref:Uncharacterized protein LOC101849510 n=1 Tax=Aplysia californica TaxID=6500 RepID=A0ABM0JBM0_APLCA|nr:uncharacterized protein LOC101849510 [Aplysia californica]